MQNCSVCLDNIKENDKIILECNHVFHKDCIKKLNNFICPLCRSNINIKKIFNINYKICDQNPLTHYGYGYSPFCKNGECRFCFGKLL